MLSLLKLICILLVSVLVCSSPVIAGASDAPIIQDEADLFTPDEEEMLREVMTPILEYGGVALVTHRESDEYYGVASALAKNLCQEYFNGDSGTVLLIDMYNRRIEIYSTGKLYRYITKSMANTITTNTYTYATAGDYATCARLCFEQMLEIAKGGHITTPLRYVSNIFSAISIALFISFVLVYISRSYSRLGKKTDYVDSSSRSNMDRGTVKILRQEMTKQRRTVHSTSSSSGGHSSGGGGGGSSSGGGGGGGHSF